MPWSSFFWESSIRIDLADLTERWNDLVVHCKINTEIPRTATGKFHLKYKSLWPHTAHKWALIFSGLDQENVDWMKRILLFLSAEMFSFRLPRFLIQVIQLDLVMLSNFSFLIDYIQIQINKLYTVNPVLFCQLQSCLAEFFFWYVMVVLGTWIQLFSHDLIINITTFKAHKILPFLIGDGIHPFHLKSDHSDNMGEVVQFQVFRALHAHLRATHKTLEKYV